MGVPYTQPSAARPATGVPVARRRHGCRSPIPTSSVNASALRVTFPSRCSPLYLAWKYHNDFEAGITANAKVGDSWLGATDGAAAKWLENQMLQAVVTVD